MNNEGVNLSQLRRGAGAREAVAIITAAMSSELDPDTWTRSDDDQDAYARDIITVLDGLEGMERLLTVAYLGDINRMLLEALSRHLPDKSPREILQDIAVMTAESCEE